MELKKLKETQEKLAWPSDSNDLPVISWESCTLFSDFDRRAPADNVSVKSKSKLSSAR